MFQAIATRNGSAKSNVDFVGKLSSQVQFNPGQSIATWKVRILQVTIRSLFEKYYENTVILCLKDENYEKEEHFFIDLSQPVMSILEEPKFARITITDQEDGETCLNYQSNHSKTLLTTFIKTLIVLTLLKK